MSPQEIGLTLELFPSPPSTLPPPPPPLQRSKSNKFMAPGTTPAASSQPRPELALYYFNSPTMLPQQKKPIPLMPSNSDNVGDVVMADGKGPETRKRERSPLPSLEDSEKGNKRKSPRKMPSSPFLAAATGHFFQAARSFSSSASASSSPVAARPGTSPKADGTTGVRDGDTVTSPTTTHPNASKGDNNAEMETVKVISRAVRQRVAQSSSPSTAASAITADTAAPARSVEVECTSPASSSASVPPAPSSSSSKSPFKKRRRVAKTERKSSPLRNTPLTASDFLASSSSSRAAASPAPSTSPSKEKKIVKRKPLVWEKRPLLQKVILKEFERTPHGAEIIRRGAKLGIAFLEEQRHLVRNAGKSGRKSTSSDEDDTAEGAVVSVKSKSKDVSSMKHWGRIVKTALAGPLKEMAGPMAGDGRPPIMIRAW